MGILSPIPRLSLLPRLRRDLRVVEIQCKKMRISKRVDLTLPRLRRKQRYSRSNSAISKSPFGLRLCIPRDPVRVSNVASAGRYLETLPLQISTRKRVATTSSKNPPRRYAPKLPSETTEYLIDRALLARPADQTAHGGRKERETRRAKSSHGGEAGKASRRGSETGSG